MITYKITSRSIQSENLSDKEKILRKATSKALRSYPVGSTARIRGSNKTALVEAICTSVEDIHWKGLKPFFLQIAFEEDGKTKRVMCHPTFLNGTL